jgi:hypothetical protein
MLEQGDFSPDIVNNLDNPNLESAIRALLYSRNDRNTIQFIRTFLKSNLIVLMETKIILPKSHILNLDQEGYAYYPKDSKIPLVQLMNEIGDYILPVFTNAQFVHKMEGLDTFYGLVISGMNCLEMYLTAGSSLLLINPGHEEQFFIDNNLLNQINSELEDFSSSPQFLVS